MREKLLDLITMVEPAETPFIDCLFRAPIPQTRDQRAGRRFWLFVTDMLHRIKVPRITHYSEEFGTAIYFANPIWISRLCSKIHYLMDRKRYSYRYKRKMRTT